MTTITDMTLEELQTLIEQTVERRLKQLLDELEGSEERLVAEGEADHRSLEEVFASIDRNMWIPPPGAKSSLELLREDRDS